MSDQAFTARLDGNHWRPDTWANSSDTEAQARHTCHIHNAFFLLVEPLILHLNHTPEVAWNDIFNGAQFCSDCPLSMCLGDETLLQKLINHRHHKQRAAFSALVYQLAQPAKRKSALWVREAEFHVGRYSRLAQDSKWKRYTLFMEYELLHNFYQRMSIPLGVFWTIGPDDTQPSGLSSLGEIRQQFGCIPSM